MPWATGKKFPTKIWKSEEKNYIQIMSWWISAEICSYSGFLEWDPGIPISGTYETSFSIFCHEIRIDVNIFLAKIKLFQCLLSALLTNIIILLKIKSPNWTLHQFDTSPRSCDKCYLTSKKVFCSVTFVSK